MESVDAVLNIGEHCLNHQLTSSCQLSQDSYMVYLHLDHFHPDHFHSDHFHLVHNNSLHKCIYMYYYYSDFVPVRWRIVKIHTAHIHSADNSPDMGTECGTEPQ